MEQILLQSSSGTTLKFQPNKLSERTRLHSPLESNVVHDMKKIAIVLCVLAFASGCRHAAVGPWRTPNTVRMWGVPAILTINLRPNGQCDFAIANSKNSEDAEIWPGTWSVSGSEISMSLDRGMGKQRLRLTDTSTMVLDDRPDNQFVFEKQ